MNGNSASSLDKIPLWEMDHRQAHAWLMHHAEANGVLVKNLETALAALQTREESQPPQAADASSPEEPAKKRHKKEVAVFLKDPYRVWLHAVPAEQDSSATTATTEEIRLSTDAATIPDTLGGRLVQLSVGGLLNGVAGVVGGLTSKTAPSAATLATTDPLPSAANMTPTQLLHYSVQLHRAIAVRVRADILVTTPTRIQALLAPDLTDAEFAAIRKRVYDTVILGKGMHNDEEVDIDAAPVASAPVVHDIEKFKKCQNCGNNDQGNFDLDRKNGDIVCCNCGVVVVESLMHEGTQYRKFEGEADRNHHGDAANPLYSNQHNMSTTLGGISQVTGAGMGGWGSSSSKRNLETILRNAHAYTELNVSQFGRTDRRTRIGYKDKQKKDAFYQMTHAGDALNLHEAVVQRAKELFAGFRDDRELVQQFKGVIAACLCEAFEQLSRDGQQILKQEQEEVEKTAAVEKQAQQQQPTHVSARAARRNELHHANLAGKGGLLLDLSGVEKDATVTTTPSANGISPKAEEKPAAAWDLDDCRSWLLEASRSIAQQWTAERQKDGPLAKQIPAGSSDELEGRLVEHSITLCEQLEAELKARQSTNAPRRGVVTPRVQDMSKLGIKWQKLGTSSSVSGKPANGHRTAGQILILKTAKKLGSILKDPLAGDAIHKELRAVIGRQEERKRQEMREEASRQRFNQMKRKPWLQARLQQM